MLGIVSILLVCCILARLTYLINTRKSLGTSAPTVQAAISAKKKLRDRQLTNGKDSRPRSTASSALPNGQFQAKNWIVLDLGIKPNLEQYNPWRDGDAFKIKLIGCEHGTSDISLQELKAMGSEMVQVDWHCVTGWSTLDLGFTGVPIAKFLQAVRPRTDWKCLWQVSADGYTVPILREDLEGDEGAFVALGGSDGAMLPLEHGGVRIVAPSLYGWKSAKFLTEIHFLPYCQKGFWEKLGCHERGRVAHDERWANEAAGVWKVLVLSADLYRIFLGPTVYFFMLWLGSTVLGWIVRLCRVFWKPARKQA